MAKVSSKNVTKKSTKKKSSSVKSKESKVLLKLENTSTNNAINTTRSNTLLRANNVTQPDVASESNSDYSVITTNNHDDNKTSSSLSGNSNYAYSMSSKGNISVNNANAEKAHNIWSGSLKRYRNSDEYKKAFNSEFTAISNKWNNNAIL